MLRRPALPLNGPHPRVVEKKGEHEMNSRGVAIAAVVAGLVAAAAPNVVRAQSGQTDKKVRCSGINTCKGQSACNTAKNSCKGQNACKGQGWLPATEKECKDKGGKVLPDAK